VTKSVPAKLFLLSLLFLAFACLSFGDAKTPLLLQTPTITKNQIAFVYGGDIWIVGREGGEARRLVTGRDLESGPIFSPDGSMIAFSGNYDSNVDVYVVPSAGGPRGPRPAIGAGRRRSNATAEGASAAEVRAAALHFASSRVAVCAVSGVAREARELGLEYQ
jgi:hypothetical protein